MPQLTGVTYRTCTCKYRRFGGGAAEGRVTFLPSVRVRTSAGMIAIPEEIEVELDYNGDLTVSLPVNDDPDLEPTGWTYLVIERIDGEKRSWSFELPEDDGSPVDLSEVAPVDPVSPATSYILASSVDDLVDFDDLEEAIEEEAAARELGDAASVSTAAADATSKANAAQAAAIAAAATDATTKANAAQAAAIAAAAADTDAEIAAEVARADGAYVPQSSDPLNARTLGAVADGVADDTTVLQAAINLAILTGRALYLPRGTYKTTAELVVSDGLTIYGDGVDAVWNSVAPADFSSYFGYVDLGKGSIIAPSTAGQNGIRITALGANVSLRGFGIRFADAIKFSNTGHGIVVEPPNNPTDATSKDHGVFNARWADLKVFGHDGNHYAYDIVNPMACEFAGLSAVGGGGMRVASNSSQFFYGNSIVTGLYVAVVDAGTADGINLGGSGSGSGGSLQLMTWIRPQVWVANIASVITGTTAPTSSQYNLRADIARTRRMLWVAPDFESNVSSPTQFPTLSNDWDGYGQITTQSASNPALPGTGGVSNGVAFQNQRGYAVLFTGSFLLNPDGVTDATITVAVGPNTDATGGPQPISVTYDKAKAAGTPSVITWLIPAGAYCKLTTTRTSWTVFTSRALRSWQA